jgi:hypothetical protein
MFPDLNFARFFFPSLIAKSTHGEVEGGAAQSGDGAPDSSPLPFSLPSSLPSAETEAGAGPVRSTKQTERAHPYRGTWLARRSRKFPKKKVHTPASKPAPVPVVSPPPSSLVSLPEVEERPPLTEKEEAVAEVVVCFAKEKLCNGDASKATFGGSLRRILLRKHPAIYLHDIPLDKEFAKTFHAKYSKEYLNKIISRSKVVAKRGGDQGNGMCVLNRLKKSDEKAFDAYLKKELK